MPDLTPVLHLPYLTPLISRADNLPRRPAIGHGRKLIAIHPTTREMRASLPFFGANQWRRYLVDASASVKKCESFHVTLTDSRGTVRRDIVCEVSIKRLEPKWEEILVNGICADATPEAAFEKHMERWLQDFVDETEKTHPDCLRRFAQYRENAQIHARASAGPTRDETGIASGLGLHLACSIKLPEDDLKPIEFMADLPRLLCSDYDDPIPSREEVHLEVPRHNADMETKAQSSGRLLEDFREDFQRETLLWFRRHGKLHNYCFKKQEVHERLMEHLTLLAEQHGREITFLRVQAVQELVFAKPENISHVATVDFDVTKAGSPEKTFKVRVNHTVQIETTDAAKWLRTQSAEKISDHREWIKTRIQKRTEDALLGKSYGDIVVEFNPSEEKARPTQPAVSRLTTVIDAPSDGGKEAKKDLKTIIQEAVESDLEAAGLSVRMFTTTPDLPARRLLVEGFRFDTQGSAEDEVFRTSDSRSDFKMAISVSGSLKSLEQFKPYLTDPDADIVSRLRQQVIQAARDVSVTFSPKQLFLDFDQKATDGKGSPCDQVSDAIKEVLTRKDGLNAVCERVVLRPLKGDFDTRWVMLTPAQNHSFKLVVGARDSGDDQMVYEVEFRVAGIDEEHWHMYQGHCVQHSAPEQIEAMIQKLQTCGEINLAQFSAETLHGQRTTTYQAKRDQIFADAISSIAEDMGLQVKVAAIVFKGSERRDILKGAAREIFLKRVEQAKTLEDKVIQIEMNPTDLDEEEKAGLADVQKKLFGGTLTNQPALPGTKGPLSARAGKAEDNEDDEFYGQKKL